MARELQGFDASSEPRDQLIPFGPLSRLEPYELQLT